ncbi:MAG: tRNA-intron lyase [Methanoregula sp.]|nr:tRNA-intron lyase [Methanoregula sp.]
MKATFDGKTVRCGRDGQALYEQSGYGRREGEGLRLAPQEALYLLSRKKIEITGYDLDSLLAAFSGQPAILRSYLVYRDLRERGYAVQTGPHDFRVFKRGQRPGKGESVYLVRVVSERDPIRFTALIEEVGTAHNMRKQYVLAVVDDEDELTYYEVKLPPLPDVPIPLPLPPVTGELVGRSVLVHIPPKSDFEQAWFGNRLDDARLLLSPLETLNLTGTGVLSVSLDGSIVPPGDVFLRAQESDSEFSQKSVIYDDLRRRGYIPKTGYKFGHHFRVYSTKKPHSDMLAHAVREGEELPMSTISRSVRLAHSVKKKMLFGCVYRSGIQYVEFARIKL